MNKMKHLIMCGGFGSRFWPLSTSVTPKQFLVSVSQSAADPGTNPNDFGSDATSRRGMMHINTSTGDIFIWS